MADEILRWGILGCGKIARKFASDMAYARGSTIVACASRDGRKSFDFASQFGISTAHASYESLLSDPSVDVVYVATPHSHHLAHVLDCLYAGKHVLCEKPMGVNARQTRDMIRLANERNCFLMEAMWTGVLPLLTDIRKKIKEGILGDIRRISADFGFSFPYDPLSRVYHPDLAGGTLLDIGIYPIYLATTILGSPTGIHSSMTKAPTGTDSECSILLTYGRGASASLYSSVTCTTPTECIITGTEGTLRIPPRFHEQSRYLIDFADGRHEEHHPGKMGYGYVHEIDHVRECIQRGLTESPVHSLADSLLLVEIMDHIRHEHRLVYPFEDDTDVLSFL